MPDQIPQIVKPTEFMLRQPKTQPISHIKLLTEAKTVLDGLVLTEAEFTEVVGKQRITEQPPTDDQWRHLRELLEKLLYEYSDFFSITQHSGAGLNLSKLPVTYSMHVRIWSHLIYSFLELLRDRLPGSLDHMQAFLV